MTTTDCKKEAATHKRALVPVLGTILVMTCLLAGFVQAADTGIGLNNGILTNGKYPELINVLASDQAPGSGNEGDRADCGEHDVRCFDKNNTLLGLISNGPCYWDDWDCDYRSSEDLDRCQERFGPDAVSSKPFTYCHWRGA